MADREGGESIMKKKLLYYGDTPNIGTGFGNVARHVLSRLADRYEITIFAINEFYTKDVGIPCKIINALPNSVNDPYGRQRFIDLTLRSGQTWDVWFLQNDIHFWYFLPELIYAIRGKGEDPHIFLYTVVDSPVNKIDIYNISVADVCGIPSQYGVDQIVKIQPEIKYKLRHVPHGIDSKEFHPLDDQTIRAIRKEKFGIGDNDYLFVNVNRNAARKDIPRTLLCFHYLKEQMANVRLYLHMQTNEEKNKGYDLDRILRVNDGYFKDVATPVQFNADAGVPIHILNQVYNAADIVISTTLGEGFGLSCVEAMAAKALVMMPDNSSLSELMADGRGISIRCGTTSSEWTILPQDPGFPRP
ncbi:MAG: glycosyltransferase family 4 protein, partial [Bacteroidetes bacterium]|nr:glycosyltransferase family 4 protein [Bacteroidota bacterium]